jgi:maleylpyruvate isomerase
VTTSEDASVLDDTLTAVARHTRLLLDHATRLADVRAPSLCEGWSRAHVLSHVARNAEAIQRLAEWALDGEPREMYPGGTAARDAAIDEGALRSGPSSPDDPRPAGVFADDLAETAERLARTLAELSGPLAVDHVEMRGGLEVSPLTLPFLRLRELVYHHVDLDDGFTFGDVEPALLVRFIDDAVASGAKVVGLTTDAEARLQDLDLTGRLVLVIGSEHEGIGRAVRRRCTTLARLTLHGPVESLNASAAAAVALSIAGIQRVK